jgi:hypothetical protein
MEQLPSTKSEVLFADYLGQAGREWSFAATIGTHRPDFLVDSRVVCEVTAIEADHLPEQVGSRDAPHPVRQKIRDKWSQAEAARKAGHPFVLVLHQEGRRADLSLRVVTSALFGDVSVAMVFDLASGTMTDEDRFVGRSSHHAFDPATCSVAVA